MRNAFSGWAPSIRKEYAMSTYSSREEIPEQYRWDLSSIFENDEAFLAALEEAKQLPPQFASYQGKSAPRRPTCWST